MTSLLLVVSWTMVLAFAAVADVDLQQVLGVP